VSAGRLWRSPDTTEEEKMGKLDGKVAVISGAARGMGRSHAVTLAREGASIVAFDICEALPTVLTPGATEADLQETARLVEAHGQRCLTAKVDARDLPALRDLADRAMNEFGRVDIVVANHGMWHVATTSWDLEEDEWNETVDVMLTGSWKVCKAFIPKIIEGGAGGSIVFMGSANSFTVQPGAADYCVAKAGVVHLMHVLAFELGKHRIRVNTVNPGATATPLVLEGGTAERGIELHPSYMGVNHFLLPIEIQPPESASNAILWLVSDDAEYVTGVALPVDAGSAVNR
jgi:(+)-trans-carveol dehydrogenase